MKIKLIFFIILNLFFLSNADAQRKRTKKKDVKTEKKADVIVFGKDEGDDGDEDDTPVKRKDIIIKTSPTSFIFGLGLIEVEKELNESFSAQVGVGVTFNSKLKSIQAILDEVTDDNYSIQSPNWTEDITDYYGEDRTSKLGYMFTLSPRIFYEGDGFEGSYFSPTFNFRKYNYEVPKIVEGSRFVQRRTDAFDTESETYKDIMVRYGSQRIFTHVTTEFFVGIGIRFTTSNRQDLGYNNLGVVSTAFQSSSFNDFNYELGLRVGYHF
jgi:hypothetical protein